LAAKNAKTIKNDRYAQRPSFAKTLEPIQVPDLLSLQTESFDWLVGNPAWREIVGPDAKNGLEEILEEI
jgi:DNA-directed RNA polymerase subunit beta